MTLVGAKILPFACKKPRRKVRLHQTTGESVTPPTVRVFIRALIEDNFPAIKDLIDQHPSLATLTGNYFALPLHIASSYRNFGLINYLIEKGACIQTALKHPYAHALSPSMRRYLYTASLMKDKIISQIF